ncbi:hypothetical protein BDN70DRAFT_197524 [Pholiota conissans]|uniref:Uncharacterized protein n=1 Tax=Pholiota conissans TaxID=109636 RepID=A0A9P5Z9K4_9AGAR|nr:hypothetical protein BDN70DRAFT_197524 [Pholiota conissans]
MVSAACPPQLFVHTKGNAVYPYAEFTTTIWNKVYTTNLASNSGFFDDIISNMCCGGFGRGTSEVYSPECPPDIVIRHYTAFLLDESYMFSTAPEALGWHFHGSLRQPRPWTGDTFNIFNLSKMATFLWRHLVRRAQGLERFGEQDNVKVGGLVTRNRDETDERSGSETANSSALHRDEPNDISPRNRSLESWFEHTSGNISIYNEPGPVINGLLIVHFALSSDLLD